MLYLLNMNRKQKKQKQKQPENRKHSITVNCIRFQNYEMKLGIEMYFKENAFAKQSLDFIIFFSLFSFLLCSFS